jgi:hypothetical protein
MPIWVVRVHDDLYVRSYRGPSGSWYRRARRNGSGRIRVGGIDRAVRFTAADAGVRAKVDEAYSCGGLAYRGPSRPRTPSLAATRYQE